MKKILWLSPPNFSGGLKSMTRKYLKRAGINLTQVEFREYTANCLYKRTKTIWETRPERKEHFFKQIDRKKYDLIVVNDKAALHYITGKYLSLALTRGSIFKHGDTPVLVIDDVKKIKSTRTGGWIMLQDLGKLQRWLHGKQRVEPSFNYTVCRSVEDVRKLSISILNSILSGIDIETTGTTISCIGYSNFQKDGTIQTFVVPFYNTTKPNGCHWETEEQEQEVWRLVKQINSSLTYKVMQNGSYDATYFTIYGVPLTNYWCDTLHSWHSIWAEAPKKLDFISSIALDFYRYWKDEGKEDADDNEPYAVPITHEGLENYWLYNALDCHNTVSSFRFIIQILMHQDWAVRNYVSEFTRQFGVNFNMSMRGTKVNYEIHSQLLCDLTEEHEAAHKDLLHMVADPEFNPNSDKQVAELLYDILGATQIPRKKRSVNEVVLKMIATQDPLLDIVIEQIWKTKKPKNNVSKYGLNKVLHGRFMYKLNTATTPTGRLASKAHDLWTGANIQNIPKRMRVMFEPDPGYVLVDIDYSQSDEYFTAYETQDLDFIATMQSGKIGRASCRERV